LGHPVFYLTTSPAENVAEPGYEVIEFPVTGVMVVKLHITGRAKPIYSEPITLDVVGDLVNSLEKLLADTSIGESIALVHHPAWRRIVERLPAMLSIYDCMDHHAGFSTHSDAMSAEETALLRAADIVFTTSLWLSERHSEYKPILVPNAAEVELFRVAAERGSRKQVSRPTVGYVGAIAEWFDVSLIILAARKYPGWDFVLYGSTTGCDTSLAKELNNVQFRGEIPYSTVPSVVAGFDVCVIPFKLTELIMATNPVKLYEYLSAGKPVVSVNLPELQGVSNLVHIAATSEEFVNLLGIAMGEREDSELYAQRQSWASNHDWSSRAATVSSAIESFSPRVSIIVLTYNNLDLTKSCLASIDILSDYSNLEIIVVDNASSDGTVDFLRNYAEGRLDVTLILNGENKGFSGGNNDGIRAARGDYVVILNNDTFVTRGWVRGLLRHLARDPSVGLVGPVTNNIGNEAKIDIAYSSMDEMAEKALAYTRAHHLERIEVDSVAFFCVMIPRRILNEVGLLDEDFSIGFFEDDDYCRRVKSKGYRIAIADDVFVHHHLSASFSALGVARKKEIFDQNRAVFEKKWGPWKPHNYRSRLS
jgi:GT2 family glycosyltransferase